MKRLLSLLIALVLATLIVSGCVKKESNETPIATTAPASTATKQQDAPESETGSSPSTAAPTPTTKKIAGELKISCLDVGQGDSIYIMLPTGETILIDAGESKNSASIIEYIKSSNKGTLDYVIATHPHADHIGGMAAVINAFNVKNVYMPDKVHTTKTFEDLIDTIEEKGLSFGIAKAGEVLFDYGNLKAEFIAPIRSNYTNLNNYSAVIMLTYNNRRFLFMGDAEKEVEAEIIAAGRNISADVLKVGHHGSNTSSSKDFIEKVNPKYAIISCGTGNSYGHPTASTLATLSGIDIYRTDEKGTIIVVCDGTNITLSNIKTEIQPRAPSAKPTATTKSTSATKQQAVAAKSNTTTTTASKTQEQGTTVYITKTGAKYHRGGCRYLSRSKIATTLASARQSYSPCSVCNPPR